MRYIWAVYQKTYLRTSPPNEDSNLLPHPRSLIRDGIVRMRELCINGYSKSALFMRELCINGYSKSTLFMRELCINGYSKSALFRVRILNSYWCKVPSCGQWRLGSDCADQTVRLRRLIWISVGRTCQKVRFLTLWLIFNPICKIDFRHLIVQRPGIDRGFTSIVIFYVG